MVWEIDGEHLIVAHSERDMRAVYLDYHGESIRGHDRRLMSPDEDVEMCDDSDDLTTVKARDLAKSRGFYPAR